MDNAWFDYSFSAVRDDDGSVAAGFDIAPETTGLVLQRRLIEEQVALAESEKRLRH